MHRSTCRRQLLKPFANLARDASPRMASASAATAAASAEGRTGSGDKSPEQNRSEQPSATPGPRLSSTHSSTRRGARVSTSSLPVSSPLYDPSFMGASSRFRMHRLPSGRTAVSRAVLTSLERERLTHASPRTINDHICITMVKSLRWLADRLFRERHIHRATMLKTVAAAPATAGSVTTYIRLTGRSASEGVAPAPLVSPLAAVPGEASRAGDSTASSSESTRISPFSPLTTRRLSSADRLAGLDTIRGFTAQAECHTAHHQILTRMAEITAVERFFVLFAQAVQFAIYAVIFLLSPRMGLRLMGYTLEESSVVWTQMINDIDLGKISERRVPALALEYWGLTGRFVAQGAPPPVVVVAAPSGDNPASADQPAGSPFGVTHPVSPPPTAGSPDTASTRITQGQNTTEPPAPSTASGHVPASTAEPFSPDDVTLTLRDVVLLIRADEMFYRDLCHKMADEVDRDARERATLPWSVRFMQWAEAWLKK